MLKVKAKKVRTVTRAAKRDFDVAHGKGMAALKRGDYQGFGDAIDREREAVESLPTPKKRTKR